MGEVFLEKERLLSLGIDVACLARAALHETPIREEELLQMDLCGIQKMAKYHSMDAIVYLSLKEAFKASGIRIDDEIDINVYKKLENTMPQIMLRSSAFSNGVAMVLCAKNYASVADIRGNVTVAGSADIIKTKINVEKDYHLVSSRRRGLYRDFNSGY